MSEKTQFIYYSDALSHLTFSTPECFISLSLSEINFRRSAAHLPAREHRAHASCPVWTRGGVAAAAQGQGRRQRGEPCALRRLVAVHAWDEARRRDTGVSKQARGARRRGSASPGYARLRHKAWSLQLTRRGLLLDQTHALTQMQSA